MDQLQRLWRWYLSFVIKHPWMVIAVALSVTAILGLSASGVRLQNGRDLWLPHGDPLVETTRQIQEVFGGRDLAIIAISPVQGDIYQTSVLEKITRVQNRILQIPEAVRNNVISLAARKVKSIRANRDGMTVRRMLASIPSTAEEMAELRRAVAENPFYIGALVSRDARTAAVVADFKLTKEAIGYSALNAAIMKVADSERDPTVKIYVGGVPSAFAAVEYYTTAAGGYFGLAFLIIMLVQYASFRSLQGMLLPTVTAILSVIWGLGVMGALHFDLDVLNTTTPILIMAITSGHAIQLLKRYYEEYGRLSSGKNAGKTPAELSKEAVVESLTRVGFVMLVAGLIAAATFYSLGLSHIEMVRHFGVFAGSGVLSGMILELTFIPALRSILRPPRQPLSHRKGDGVLDRLLSLSAGSAVGSRAVWVFAIGTATIVFLGIGVANLKVDNSTLRYLGPSNQVRVDDRMINRELGGTNTVYFFVEGSQPDSMKDPRVLVAMDHLQAFLEQQPGVGKTQSLADLVKRMNQVMHGDDPRYSSIPQDRSLIAQYLLLYSLSGEPEDFDNFVDTNYQKALVWTYVKDDSTAFFENLATKVEPLIKQEFPPGVNVRIGGSLAEISAINHVVVREKLINTAQMAIVIFLLTSVMLRSVIGGLFIVIPVLIIVVANFGIMGWLGLPLDMGTATTASMAIGIGADYEIYLLYRFREELARTGDWKIAGERSLQTSGKAILYVALAIAGGYSVLFASDFMFYSRLAMTVITTMAISALSAILFLRAMFAVFRPRFAFAQADVAARLRYAGTEHSWQLQGDTPETRKDQF